MSLNNLIQVGGDHYKTLNIQPWEAMEAWMSPVEFKGYLCGNVIKYVARHHKKGGLQDLEKAQHYLSKLIEKSRPTGGGELGPHTSEALAFFKGTDKEKAYEDNA